MRTKIYLSILALFSVWLTSCQHSFLDAKPDKSLMVPSTLDDFQALLDNHNLMNIVPGLNIIASDDYYIEENSSFYLQIFTPGERNSYLWKSEIWEGQMGFDWETPYQQVFYANVVLDGLKESGEETEDKNRYNAIKGSALFFRAFAFYNIAQLFAPPYNDGIYESDLGVPLRLEADVNIKVRRSTIEETYERIIADLKESADLLPEFSEFKNRPSKVAVFALLARTYLSMGDYENALLYSDSCLALNSNLMNYADLDKGEFYPFPEVLPNGNTEVIFHYWPINYSFFDFGIIKVDSTVYNSYHAHDLRKSLYFYENGTSGVFFTGYMGLCVDEQFLIKAECLSRIGSFEQGLDVLNVLLEKRWEEPTFSPIETTTRSHALEIILLERRKELIGRDVRWTDLRRLNQHQETRTELTRILGGELFTLYPNDNKYVLPIPDEEIQNGDIQQNVR